MFRTASLTIRSTDEPLLLHLDGELRAAGGAPDRGDARAEAPARAGGGGGKDVNARGWAVVAVGAGGAARGAEPAGPRPPPPRSRPAGRYHARGGRHARAAADPGRFGASRAAGHARRRVPALADPARVGPGAARPERDRRAVPAVGRGLRDDGVEGGVAARLRAGRGTSSSPRTPRSARTGSCSWSSTTCSPAPKRTCRPTSTTSPPR